ncbi:MAG: hypothetical protein OXF00_09785 [bacterium]|nr:hypothetical protein [bacterium]
MSASDPISEKVRWALRERLIEVLGEEEAETLMESLPPVVWHQIATKDDLSALEQRLRTEMNGQFAAFKAEVIGEFAAFKGEMIGEFAAFKSEVVGEFTAFKGEMIGEFAGFKGEVKGEFALQIARLTRMMVLTFIGVSVAMLGAMTAIVYTAPA